MGPNNRKETFNSQPIKASRTPLTRHSIAIQLPLSCLIGNLNGLLIVLNKDHVIAIVHGGINKLCTGTSTMLVTAIL
jgi:hypothetical protein